MYFLSECLRVGESLCRLAKKGDSLADIDNRIEGFINGLNDKPLPVPDADKPGVLTSGRARRKLSVSETSAISLTREQSRCSQR